MSVPSDLQQVLRHFDIGELVDQQKDTRGFVNTSFIIETLANGMRRKYFLRRYKTGIKEEELVFEHSLVNHLVSKKFPYAAGLIPTREGKTYLRLDAEEPDQAPVFYAIFEYLPGEDRYTWVNPTCTQAELTSAAAVLAHFHAAVSDLQPHGRRAEPDILHLLPIIAANVEGCREKLKNTAFDICLLENLNLVQAAVANACRVLSAPGYRDLVRMVIHCDYHPGNLKFQGEQVTGLYDFDWSKMDSRAFDLALGLWYFCTSWSGDSDGHLRLDRLASFLNAYQEVLVFQHGVGPLSRAEQQYLPDLVNAGNLYILNWTILDYYNKDVNPTEYLVYLRHSINFTKWFMDNDHRREFEQVVALIQG